MEMQRPLGVTIIAILNILGGVGLLLGGSMAFDPSPLEGIITGGIFVVIGLASFVIGYGLWKGKGWAWRIALILSVIAIILGIGSIAVGDIGALVYMLINAIVIYYLYRPNVKAYFGK